MKISNFGSLQIHNFPLQNFKSGVLQIQIFKEQNFESGVIQIQIFELFERMSPMHMPCGSMGLAPPDNGWLSCTQWTVSVPIF